MLANRHRDTSPELALRRALHARGLRFFVDRAPLPGIRRRADILFPRRRVAIYVDGCFWHGCPLHGSQPKANADYWGPKLARNRVRDRETDASLREAGWLVIRVWEHEPADEAADRIATAIRQ